MEQTLSLSNKKILLSIAQFSILLAIICVAPLIKNQFITGTIVNASLLIATILLGLRGGLLLSLIPSIFSLSFGLLPLVMAPMIPFIIAGNMMLVLIFNLFKKDSYWKGVILGSLLKSSFLFLIAQLVIGFFVKQQVAANIAVMMSWPQLITALLGGSLTYILYKNGKIKES